MANLKKLALDNHFNLSGAQTPVEFQRKAGNVNISASHAQDFLSLKNDLRSAFLAGQDLGLIGYGICYQPAYQFAFTDYVLLDYYIAIPPRANGNLQHYLFLTASNACAKGVEAYISYYTQDNPEFLIWDWSIPGVNAPIFHLTYQELQPFLFSRVIYQFNVDCIRVLNYSERVNGNNWQNRVLLLDPAINDWKQIYQRDYAIQDDNELKDPTLGFWGPIMETRQTNYTQLSPMGFADATLYNDVTSHTKLDTINTFRRFDQQVTGVDVIHLEPNHTFLIS